MEMPVRMNPIWDMDEQARVFDVDREEGEHGADDHGAHAECQEHQSPERVVEEYPRAKHKDPEQAKLGDRDRKSVV